MMRGPQNVKDSDSILIRSAWWENILVAIFPSWHAPKFWGSEPKHYSVAQLREKGNNVMSIIIVKLKAKHSTSSVSAALFTNSIARQYTPWNARQYVQLHTNSVYFALCNQYIILYNNVS